MRTRECRHRRQWKQNVLSSNLHFFLPFRSLFTTLTLHVFFASNLPTGYVKSTSFFIMDHQITCFARLSLDNFPRKPAFQVRVVAADPLGEREGAASLCR